jgi:hypothetical protein
MFEMQFYFENRRTGKREWKSIAPTRGIPYRYKTEAEARKMLDMCYPTELPEHKRVIRVGGQARLAHEICKACELRADCSNAIRDNKCPLLATNPENRLEEIRAEG